MKIWLALLYPMKVKEITILSEDNSSFSLVFLLFEDGLACIIGLTKDIVLSILIKVCV